MNIQYAYTILYVQDVQKTITFYHKAFEFDIKFITPEGDYGEIITGSTTIAFARHDLGRSNFKKGFLPSDASDKPFGIELAFTTSDVESVMHRAVDHGATIYAAAVEKPWGQTVAYLRDPNGFLIEVCTVMNAQ